MFTRGGGTCGRRRRMPSSGLLAGRERVPNLSICGPSRTPKPRLHRTAARPARFAFGRARGAVGNSRMVGYVTRYLAVRSYVKRLSHDLVRRFGKKPFYSVEQVT